MRDIIDKNNKQTNVTRSVTASDRDKIFRLYQQVSRIKGGIARAENEINYNYIDGFLLKSKKNGIQLVVENPEDSEQLIAEIHCYKLDPNVFNHILSELTIVVHPDFQHKGIGKLIFSQLLTLINTSRTDILRVELIVRESNKRAIKLYLGLGFSIEGRFEKRIQSAEGIFEADIPMAWINKNYVFGKN